MKTLLFKIMLIGIIGACLSSLQVAPSFARAPICKKAWHGLHRAGPPAVESAKRLIERDCPVMYRKGWLPDPHDRGKVRHVRGCKSAYNYLGRQRFLKYIRALVKRDCAILYRKGWRKGRPYRDQERNGERFSETKRHPQFLEYRGYKVEVSRAKQHPKYKVFEDSLKHQIDIVENVNLKPSVKKYFQNKKFIVTPKIKSRARFKYSRSAVLIKLRPLPKKKPILLHELLHAYHNEMMPQGRQNADILRFYRSAKENRLYPEGAYIFKNPAEFFAMTASTFLHGKTERHPYTRENIKDLQPDYYQFLTTVFSGE
jgi:hypothetical protein